MRFIAVLGICWGMIAYSAELRIPLNLNTQLRIPVQLLDGQMRNIRSDQKPVLKYLRADIDKKNRFYIDDLLIESIPVDVDLNAGMVKLDFRLSQISRHSDDIEQYLGEVRVDAEIKKLSSKLYELKGFKSVRFPFPGQSRALAVAFGLQDVSDQKRLARSEQP